MLLNEVRLRCYLRLGLTQQAQDHRSAPVKCRRLSVAVPPPFPLRPTPAPYSHLQPAAVLRPVSYTIVDH